MKQEQKEREKEQVRIITKCTVFSMGIAFATVALVVNILIKSETWLWESIAGACLSIGGEFYGMIDYASDKGDSFLQEILMFIFVFIILMDIGLFVCMMTPVNPKICILSTAISYLIGFNMGGIATAGVKQIEEKEEDNQEE